MARSKMGSSPVWRAVAALAAAMLIAGALNGGSAIAGKFLTKKKADKRYYNVGETVALAANADKLDGLDSLGLRTTASGAVNDTDVDNFTTGTFTSIISTNITAPTSGVLFVTGSVSSGDDASLGGTGRLRFRLRLDSTPVTNDPFAYSQGGVADHRAAGSASAVVPVSAGAHTVHLDAYDDGGGSYIFIRDISVIFIPSGSGVAIPARVPGPAAGAQR